MALWAVPRSVSTAFERVFIGRDDATVVHEPFSHAFYFGPERRSRRFAGQPPDPEQRFAGLRDRVLAADEATILFMKEMAYQVAPLGDPAFYGSFINTFIIRESCEALACTPGGRTSPTRRLASRRRAGCSIA